MTEPDWLARCIEYFSNETDELVGEFNLPQVELRDLQKLWNLPLDEPIVGGFEITEAQAQFFRDLASIDFDFTKYSFILDAYTTDWEATRRAGGYMGLFPPPRTLLAFPDAQRVMLEAEG
ncbi:hypothetical protein C1752_01578 [Acaryochloris thomasi RCC1774]|uniref:DUF7683 domain-containing protein n=1 Tax=Acaryochloris thomasi RCC1774 TaxID=1764569 RepID=A0A2W1JKV2_9CYAN|nr:hypothetical protein [Acaryochloris thomasi]PZD73999.1 hypothetical protein C1752_01578 [Acaryochloris thomasi RCC1774]